jgi:hypothetical protein
VYSTICDGPRRFIRSVCLVADWDESAATVPNVTRRTNVDLI